MALSIAIFCSAALLLAQLGQAQGQHECFNINTSTHRIIDAQGRERYFHGMNVVVKGPPWIPETQGFDPRWSFSQKDMQTLESLGLNAIRLGMMWPGAEPQRDRFNETYFDIAKWIVKMLVQNNPFFHRSRREDVYLL